MSKGIALFIASLSVALFFSVAYAKGGPGQVSGGAGSVPPGLQGRDSATFPRGLEGRRPAGWDHGKKTGWKKTRRARRCLHGRGRGCPNHPVHPVYPVHP